MPRPCSVCITPQKRARVDQELAAGVRPAKVAESLGYSTSVIYRHRAHSTRSLLREAHLRSDFSGADILGDLADSLEDIRSVRQAALARGDAALLLRAARTGVDLVSAISSTVGLDALEIARELKAAEALAKAVAKLVRAHPDTGLALAILLRESEEGTDMADEIQKLAEAVHAKGAVR